MCPTTRACAIILDMFGFGLNFYKFLAFLSLLIVEFPDFIYAFSEIEGSSLPRDVS